MSRKGAKAQRGKEDKNKGSKLARPGTQSFTSLPLCAFAALRDIFF
jgi:hypothetical protein